MRWQRYLRNIYRDLKRGGSYQSADKLYHTVKKEGKFKNISLGMIRKWLGSEDSYTLNKEVRRKFPINHMEMGQLDSIHEADLAFMGQYSKRNDDIKYLLGLIDTLSRKLWMRPLKTKHGSEIVKALKDIFKESGRIPRTIRSDKGSEFANKVVAQYLKSVGIGQTFTSNQSQAAIIERCFKSLKKRTTKFMDDNRTSRYIDVLQDLVKGYNETFHSGIGMTPNEVSSKNELETEYNNMVLRRKRQGIQTRPVVKVKQEEKPPDADIHPAPNTAIHELDPIIPILPKKKKFKFDVGDFVRVSLRPEKIVTEYKHRWSEEIFVVRSRKYRNNIAVYKVEDLEGDTLYGAFYTEELQKVAKPKKNKVYDIKKIIKERTVMQGKKKVKQYYVSFVGFPAKFNQWVPESAIKSFHP